MVPVMVMGEWSGGSSGAVGADTSAKFVYFIIYQNIFKEEINSLLHIFAKLDRNMYSFL